MSELVVLEPRIQNPSQQVVKIHRTQDEQIEDAERWIGLLAVFPKDINARMALTVNYLRQFGVTLGEKARKRLRRRWREMAQMTEPLDRLCWLAMEGAVEMDGDKDRKEECRKLAEALIKQAEQDREIEEAREKASV